MVSLSFPSYLLVVRTYGVLAHPVCPS
ncbi:hypothetical protein F01_570100 [Burkholderia cenocepacia]|nr:hypothetical protein F01_570100 [Burkholderia cenocepacia]